MADDMDLEAILAAGDMEAGEDDDTDANILASLLGGGGSGGGIGETDDVGGSGGEEVDLGDLDLDDMDLGDLDLKSLGINMDELENDGDDDRSSNNNNDDDNDENDDNSATHTELDGSATAASTTNAAAVADEGPVQQDDDFADVTAPAGTYEQDATNAVLADVDDDTLVAANTTGSAHIDQQFIGPSDDADELALAELVGDEEEGVVVDVVVAKAPKPMGFGIKFGSVGVEALVMLNWPNKFSEPGVEERLEYIIVSRLQEENPSSGVANPARLAGVEAGDVVLEMNGVPIFSTADMKAANKKGAKSLQLRVVRRGTDLLAQFDSATVVAPAGRQRGKDTEVATETEPALDFADDDAELTALLQMTGGDGDPKLTEHGANEDLDRKLNELGLDLNIDLGDIDFSNVPGLEDIDGSLTDVMDDGTGAQNIVAEEDSAADAATLPVGRKLTVTVQRRRNFGFGIMFAHVPVHSLAFDFDGKGEDGTQEYMIVNRFKEVQSGVGENPAEAADLRPGDVILTINGVSVRDNAEVATQLKGQSAIEVGIVRESSAEDDLGMALGLGALSANTPGIDRLLSELNRGGGDFQGDDINKILMDANLSPMLDSAARRDLLKQLESAGDVEDGNDVSADTELAPYLLSPLSGSRPSEIDNLLKEMQVPGHDNDADGSNFGVGDGHLGIIDLLLQDDDHAIGAATADATEQELLSYVPESQRKTPGGSRDASSSHPKRLKKQHALELIIAVRPTISPSLWGHVSGGGGSSQRGQPMILFPAGGIKTVIYCSYGSSGGGVGKPANSWSPYEETEKAAVDIYEFQRRVSVVRMEVDLSKSSSGMRLEQELKFEVVGFDGTGHSFTIGEAVIDVTDLCCDGSKTTKRVALSRRATRGRKHSSFNEDSFGHDNSDSPEGASGAMTEINAYVTVVAEPMDPHRLVWHSQLKLADLKPAQTCRVAEYGNVPIPSLLEYLWRQAMEAGALQDHEGLAYVLKLPVEVHDVSPRMRTRFDKETRDVKRDISNLRFNADLVDAQAEAAAAAAAGGSGKPISIGGFLGAKAAEQRSATPNGRYSSMVYLFLWHTVVGTISPKLLSPASFGEAGVPPPSSSSRKPPTSALQSLTNLEERKISEIESLLKRIPEPGHTVLLWVLDRVIDIFEQSDLDGLDLRVLARAMTPALWSSSDVSSSTSSSRGGHTDHEMQGLAASELVLVLLRWRKRWRQYSTSFVGPLIELQAAKEARGLDSADKGGDVHQYLVDKQQISEGDESLLNLQALDEVKRRMDALKSKSGRSRLVVTALTAHHKYGIAIGTHMGEVFVFDHNQKLRATLPGPARCPVQCLAFSRRDDYLAAGYLNADVVLFDFRQRKQLYLYHEKRQLRSIGDPKMQAFSQIVFLDVPGQNAVPQILGVDLSRAVWHLRYRRILNIWSVDPQPVVNWPTFRVLSVATVPAPRYAVALGQPALVALTIVHPNIQTVLVEFSAKRKLVVNKETVLCRLPVNTDNFDLSKNSAILLAWRWTDEQAASGPILARSYGSRLEIFMRNPSTQQWGNSPAAVSVHRADADIVAMEWLCEDRVLYLSNDHHVSIFDTLAKKCVVTIRLQPWAVRGTSNGLTEYLAATCNQKFYFIALSGNADGKLGLVTMRPEDELMTIFISKNDWQKALSLGVQRWANQRPELVGPDAAGLLDVYLNVHFEQESIGPAESSSALARSSSQDILRSPEYADLVKIIGMAFDFCLRCNRHLTKDLLEELDKHCRQRSATATNIFYQLLIANLRTGRMAPPSLSSIKGLIEHCGGSGRNLGRLERSLVEVNWSYDDAGDLIELCEQRRILHGLLIHMCTKVFDPADFLTPLRVLTLTLKDWDRPRLKQRLLLYLYCCFNGLRFPDGPQLSVSESSQALNSTLCELFGVSNFDSHASPRSRARTAASQASIPKALPLSSPDHPLRILLHKMSAEFLAVLEPVIVRIWQPQKVGSFRRGGAMRNRRRGAAAYRSAGPSHNPYNPMAQNGRGGSAGASSGPSAGVSAQLTLEQMVAGLVIVSADWVDNSSGIDPQAVIRKPSDGDELEGPLRILGPDGSAEPGATMPSTRRQHVDVNRYEAQVCRNIYAFVARLLLQRIHMPTPASLLWGTIIELAAVYRRLVMESTSLDVASKARTSAPATRGAAHNSLRLRGDRRAARGGHGRHRQPSHAALQLQASAVMRRRKLDLQLRTCREAVAELVSRVPSTTDLDGGLDPMPMRAYNKLRSVELYRYAAEFAKKAGSHTRALQAYLESPKNAVRQEAFQFLHEEARRHDAVLGDFDDFASGAASQSSAAQRAQQVAASGGKVSAGILHLQQVVSFNLRRLLQTDSDKTGQMMQTLWGGLTTKYIRGVLLENPRNLLSQLRKLRLHQSCNSAEVVQLAIKHEAYEAAAELKWRDGATAESEALLVEGIKRVLQRLVSSFEASNKAQFSGSAPSGGNAHKTIGTASVADDEQQERLEKDAAADARQAVDVSEGTEAITAYLNQAVTFCKEHWERLNKSMAAFQADLHDITKVQYQKKLEKRATQLWDALLNNFLTFLKRFTSLSDVAQARVGSTSHAGELGSSLSSSLRHPSAVDLRSSRSGTRTRRGTEIGRRGDWSPAAHNHVRRLETVRDFLHGCISRVLTDCRGQMRLDQVLQKLLSDKAADSLKFTEIKFLVLDMLRGVEFERIALNISTDAARQAVMCGKRLAVDPAQRAAGSIDNDFYDTKSLSSSGGSRQATPGGGGAAEEEESKGGENTAKHAHDLGQFFLHLEQGVLPFPQVLKQFMDEESTTSALHIANRNQRRSFGIPRPLAAPQAKRHIQFPSQLLGGGGSGAKANRVSKVVDVAPDRSSQGGSAAVQRPVGGISLDF